MKVCEPRSKQKSRVFSISSSYDYGAASCDDGDDDDG